MSELSNSIDTTLRAVYGSRSDSHPNDVDAIAAMRCKFALLFGLSETPIYAPFTDSLTCAVIAANRDPQWHFNKYLWT